MKKALLSLVMFPVLFFASCATTSTPPPLPPFMGIADAQKLGSGPAETSKYAIVVHYENVIPGKHEIKIGFGYNPTNEDLRAMATGSLGLHAIAHSEVLQQPSGDIRITLEPTVVQNLGGTLNGRIHALLSPYPHGKEWKVIRQDVFVLP